MANYHLFSPELRFLYRLQKQDIKIKVMCAINLHLRLIGLFSSGR